MLLDAHSLTHGANLELTLKTPTHGDAHGLVAVLGGGRGCVLRVTGQTSAVWIPLRGRLQIDAANADSVAMPGEMRVTEPEARIHAIGRGNALWIGLFGHPHAWRRALGGLIELPTPEPVLLPARHRADNALRRRVFLRLQRVRNYLASNCHLDIDNESLARMASYSPWHFIRAFRAAYQETPHAYLVRMRLERARRLLSQSPLAIAEIALASGFENRCAFSRLFRERFGVTAGAMRRGDAANLALTDSAVGF
jgi:AraC family transcriptional regulator